MLMIVLGILNIGFELWCMRKIVKLWLSSVEKVFCFEVIVGLN